ncbi:hypothetical protein D8674_025356 [Pyrus ussuriensis x Pyrus communis]|uniref:Uncharacterized protein n=1 Tax=Pyrus ussuriensis x Pyrus communis TaxID=2448454 RepID=A0A5N5HIV7_9ROSA|nr:hypothetical protein D8674_025356 [Pyrus ussuriensis x Pyrus communis]
MRLSWFASKVANIILEVGMVIVDVDEWKNTEKLSILDGCLIRVKFFRNLLDLVVGDAHRRRRPRKEDDIETMSFLARIGSGHDDSGWLKSGTTSGRGFYAS